MHCAAAARRVHGDRLHSVRPPVAVVEPPPSSEASTRGTLITLPATVACWLILLRRGSSYLGLRWRNCFSACPTRSWNAHIADYSGPIRSLVCNVELARTRKRPPRISLAGSKRRRCCSKPRHSQVESLRHDDTRQSQLRNALRGTTEGYEQPSLPDSQRSRYRSRTLQLA